MNHAYRLIWSDITNTWVAVAEFARACGKRASSAVLMAAVTSAWAAPPVNELPTGGNVVAGQATISQTGSILDINQTTGRAAVNWNTFNVGRAATVNFIQPSSSSVILNRVLDSNPSQIFGQIHANGQVFLTNSSGIYFAPGASVDVGGVVATTHNISNENFMAGRYIFNRNGATGSVINAGELTASLGGYIALLAPEVRNNGIIVAQMGTVALAAGEAIELQFDGNNTLAKLRVEPATIAALVENGNAVHAPGGLILLSAQAVNSLQGGVVNNTGMLEATGLVNNGGTIRLEASHHIRHTGIIKADAAENSSGNGGTVTLIASLANHDSKADINGSISARGGKFGGNGGFVETSAGRVQIGGNTRIATTAPKGKSGTWLIDPVDFTIAASGGDMTGATLSANLGGGDIAILSSNGVIGGTAGNVNVNDVVTWSANLLTLNAQNNINVNANLNGSGTASLALEFGQGAVAAGNTSNIITTNAAVNLPAGTTNFTTRQGSDGVVKAYTVITAPGAAGSATSTDLQGMNGSLSTNYALGSNINAATTSGWNACGTCNNGGAGFYGFAPIGDNATQFTGIFDGLGHTISNLTINRPTTDYVGLFGAAATGSVIRNLGMTGGSVTGASLVGGLVGQNYGTVNNSYATANATGTGSNVGGLVGYNRYGTINASYAAGVVTGGGANIGGLVGFSNNIVSNSYATGNVTGGSYNTGGLVGINDGGTISNSYVTGSTVTGTGNSVGGLVGLNYGGTISNSYVTSGNVAGVLNVGGVLGGGYGTVTNSHYDIDAVTINASHNVTTGGLYNIGGTGQFHDWLTNGLTLNIANYASTLVPAAANSYSIGNIQAMKDLLGFADNPAYTFSLTNNLDLTPATGLSIPYLAGTFDGTGFIISNLTYNQPASNNAGLFGFAATGSVIRNLGLTGASVTGASYVGGLVGLNYGAISNSYVVGNVNGASYVGGLMGSNKTTGTISNSYAAVNVTGTNNIGGLVGYHEIGSITNSYATGTVNGTNKVGGLVGYGNGSITNSYATGSVTGTGDKIGGLVGHNYGVIDTSYATGAVSGATNVGGLAGVNSVTITKSFYNSTVNASLTGIGGLADVADTVWGMSTANMQTQANFTSVTANNGSTINPAWDFASTWVMFEGASNPLLRSFMTALSVTANDATKTYDGLAYSGSGGVTYSVAPNNANLLGTLSYSSGINVGSYAITPGGLYSNQQGYIISYIDGTLTITAAPSVLGTDVLPTPPPPPFAAPPLLPTPATSSPPLTLPSTSEEAGVTVSLTYQPSTVDNSASLAVSVPRAIAATGSGFSFQLPVESFVANGSDIQVTTASGGPLPYWLRYMPDTRTFVASALPDDALPIELIVTISGQRTTIVISEQAEE